MTISYNWLSEYLPQQIDPKKLSEILTSIGLEVESLECYESIRGGLQGLVVGHVLETEQHPNADKLKLTKVDTGGEAPLQIVCGAPNVAAGQKVIVATVGTTIYPAAGDSITMKLAKIRGVESFGMICAEDEIGLSDNHAGILILPEDTAVGTPVADLFKPYSDWIYEIGLTPNRMDAMSHYGVAKDVCAYLSHHQQVAVAPINIFNDSETNDALKTTNESPVAIEIKNNDACQRYAGISIQNVTVKESPKWLKDKLQSIGLRPINNIVDITNYILHETGQPLHAFDAAKIAGNKVVVNTLPENTLFTTLDGKERKLLSSDLMICNGNLQPMCIAGVFGGADSGVSDSTKNIFLESAWFHPSFVRTTSLKHGLRTDAATRFEKGVDIDKTVDVLLRAAKLIAELGEGKIAGTVTDIYPDKKPKQTVVFSYAYLTKLSGKYYSPEAVKRLLTALNFEVLSEDADTVTLSVPYSKPDISIAADLVEEVLRIDGLDNIAIPQQITITPSVEKLQYKESLKEKIAQFLIGGGFSEIFTNSITNSKYYNEAELTGAVKLLNNLSADLDLMRPSVLETGLEAVAYNINRKNNHLSFFEFGKTYHQTEAGKYYEEEHIALYITGKNHEDFWNEKSVPQDFYKAKGIVQSLLQLTGINNIQLKKSESAGNTIEIWSNKNQLGIVQKVAAAKLKKLEVKQDVYFIDIDFLKLLKLSSQNKIVYSEVSKFPAVQRDIALVLDKQITYVQIEESIGKVKLPKLQSYRLFDVFENEKLGINKQSLAINFTFLDEEKTLTDAEIDAMMKKLTVGFEKDLGVEIRK
ncbi:MAG: phenylalanine--tRNA ligase subunit beta [Bacteroidota bacterium]